MGYTTEFSGRFNTSRPLTARECKVLNTFANTRHGGGCHHFTGMRGFWCQWVPTDDGTGIEWDGGEKFYNYTAWLEYLIDNFFRPNGIMLNGTVTFVGEEDGDVGSITVEDNKVTLCGQGEGDTDWSGEWDGTGREVDHFAEVDAVYADLWRQLFAGKLNQSRELFQKIIDFPNQSRELLQPLISLSDEE